MAKVPKKPGTYTVNGRRIRRLANGQVRFLPNAAKKAPRRRATVQTRQRAPAKTAPRRRKTTMPSKQLVDMKAVTAGLAAGAGATLAQNIPGLGRFAPAVGLAVGGHFAGDASTKKVAQFLAGLSLGNAVLPSAIGGNGGGGLL